VGVGGMRICWKGRGYAGRVEDMLEGRGYAGRGPSAPSSNVHGIRGGGDLRLRRLHRAQAGRHRHAHMEKAFPPLPPAFACGLRATTTVLGGTSDRF
jgi:hypothetical protein